MSIRDKLDCDTRFISRWRGRFIAEGLAGLFSRHAGRASYKVDERVEAKILASTGGKTPADGSTHWLRSRKLAGELGGVSHMTVARVWAKHRLKPHRLEHYMASDGSEVRGPKPPTSLGCTSIRPSMQRCSRSMRKRRFRP